VVKADLNRTFSRPDSVGGGWVGLSSGRGCAGAFCYMYGVPI
jgi:hypothetical protein